MTSTTADQLAAEALITEEELTRVRYANANPIISLHHDLNILLYASVLALTTGLGILVYKNIDTIGHQVILAVIAAGCIGSFTYCYRQAAPFRWGKVASPGMGFDYLVLLGCSLLLIFTAYLQVQYQVFGERYGLATFIPMLGILIAAYYFDHLGVLAIGITLLAAWLGLTVTPARILAENDFQDHRIIFTAIGLGIFLAAISRAIQYKGLKPHFAYSYANFGLHLFMIGTLAAMFEFPYYFLWSLVLAVGVVYYYLLALRERSFFFLLCVVLYGFTGFTYVLVRMMDAWLGMEAIIELVLLYFIGSTILLILFLINANRKIKSL